MMNEEENLKNEQTPSIMLLGDKVLIQLREVQDHTKTDAGLYIPHNELTETDGGKVTTRPSGKKYYGEGTILQITKYANEKLMETNGLASPLEAGTKVLVSSQAMNNNIFHFYTDRSKLVQDFKGIIAIPHTLIEAILI